MFFFIAIHGGLLIMMGQHARSESLFYYFRIEDQVPENHLLRLLDRHISFDFVREKQFYLAATAQNPKRLARYLKPRSLESAPIPI
jgi:transposase